MAERHHERGRRYPEDYRHYADRPDYGESRDRGFLDRAGDEVRSWFGDDEAEARRSRDEARERWETGARRREAWPADRWDRVPDERFGGGPRDYGRGWREQERARRGRDYERPRSGWGGDWNEPSEGVGGLGAGWGAGTAGWAGSPGAAAYRGRGPRGYRRSDERIREEVCDRLTDDPYVDASDVEVEVKEGEVVLSGHVSSRDQKRRVEDLAENVSGVVDVTNRVRTARAGEETGGGIGRQEKGQPGSVLGTRET